MELGRCLRPWPDGGVESEYPNMVEPHQQVRGTIMHGTIKHSTLCPLRLASVSERGTQGSSRLLKNASRFDERWCICPEP